MRYIGSKERLLDFIDSVLIKNDILTGVFCDIFSGTGVVAKYFKEKNYKVISNDSLLFSYILQFPYIKMNVYPEFANLDLKGNNNFERCKNVINYLNLLEGTEGFIYRNYSPAGKENRMYFTEDNAKKIDAIRTQIENWYQQNLINENEHNFLLCSLIEAVPFVSNIAGVYGAFLKKWDNRAFKNLTLEVPQVIESDLECECYNKDANDLIRDIKCDILYLDPPYNERQYIANYHILETIARWDSPNIYGKTGLRPYQKEKSKYCMKNKVLEVFEDLIMNADTKYILLSYNTEGIMKSDDIIKILSKRGKVEVYKQDYRRYRSDSDSSKRKYKSADNVVKEVIYFCKVEGSNKKLAKEKMHKEKHNNSNMIETLVGEYRNNIPKEFLDNIQNVELKGKYSLLLDSKKELGAFDVRNKLNDLCGKEWLYFLNSVETTAYSVNGREGFSHHLRKQHPSPKPPQLMEKIIKFFTKEGQYVLDPFVGVGGTLLGASLCNRNAVGIDLSEKYKSIYRRVVEEQELNEQTYIVGNSKNIERFDEIKDIVFDFILTDPPYGDMLSKKRTGERKKKKKDDSATPFTNLKEDLGNMDKETFLEELKLIIKLCVKKLKNKGYVAIFVKDVQPRGKELNMLHYEIANKLNEIPNLYYKGMKIWYDKTINLYPFGYPYAYTMNQLHQYILFFRKEN